MPDSSTAAPRRGGPSRGRRIFLYSALFVLAISTFCVSALNEIMIEFGATPIDLIPRTPGTRAFKDKNRLNILCLGVDYNHDSKSMPFTKWARTDTMFVVSVEKTGKILNILSIPRDARVEIPGYGYDKINAAYAMEENGARHLAQRTVEKFLGVPIDYVIVIKAYAAERLVDALGGVTVAIDKDMDYDDNWGNLHIHLKKGVQRLNGAQAVGFIRFRADEEGDRGRIRRQQQFINALVSEARSYQSLSRISGIVRAVRDNVFTDLPFGSLVDLALVYRGFDRKNMRTAKIDGDDAYYDGIAYIEPIEADKKRLVARMLKGDGRIGTADIRVEILNGSDVAGAAKTLGDYFSAKGYNVVRVASDPDGEKNSTVMLAHRSDPEFAVRLTKELGPMQVVPDPRQDGDADVTIVLGKDWRTRHRPI